MLELNYLMGANRYGGHLKWMLTRLAGGRGCNRLGLKERYAMLELNYLMGANRYGGHHAD